VCNSINEQLIEVDKLLKQIHEQLPEEYKHLAVDVGKSMSELSRMQYNDGWEDARKDIMDMHHF